MIDPARAYNAGVVQVSLNAATTALRDAFGAALAEEDYASPLVQAVIAAQRQLTIAHGHPIEWHTS